MSNICAFLPNKFSNRPRIPRNLHPKRSTNEAEAKGTNGAPTKRQKILLAPGIQIIPAPSPAPEDEVFFYHNNDVNYCPVSDDAEEGLESSFRKESSGATADDDCSDETECDEDYARDAQRPWTKVLSVHCKGVVVWDVVLRHVSGCSGDIRRRLAGMELKAANTMRNLPNPPAGSKAIFSGPPTPYARYACFQAGFVCAPE